MIVDAFKNRSNYIGIKDDISLAFKFIEDFNERELPIGRYDIQGDNVYAMVQSYDTLSQTEKEWETHKEYIDIQYIIDGNEKIYWMNMGGLQPCTKYDVEKDCTFFKGHEGNGIALNKGDFMILFPEDAHKPGCTNFEKTNVKKIVIKVKNK